MLWESVSCHTVEAVDDSALGSVVGFLFYLSGFCVRAPASVKKFKSPSDLQFINTFSSFKHPYAIFLRILHYTCLVKCKQV